MAFSHRYELGRTYGAGEHSWHYKDTNCGASHAIVVLRYGGTGTLPSAVCLMDTVSNPTAEQDADSICAALTMVCAALAASAP